MSYIKQGYGFYVNQDFARAAKDISFQFKDQRGQDVYGYISGDPSSKLGFLRPERILVRTRRDCISDIGQFEIGAGLRDKREGKLVMKRFRTDNTEGYDTADLAALNEAFDIIMSYEDCEDSDKSHRDAVAEALLARYDRGLRGKALRGL